MTYPNGGTPPTHFDITPVHEALAMTGSNTTNWLLVGVAVLACGLCLWGIAYLGRHK